MDDLLRAYNRVEPGVSFEITQGNGETVQLVVMAESSDWGLLTHLPSDSELWSAAVGTDALAVVVHARNPLTDLPLSDVRAIYQGRIRNWNELGGPDMAITVVSREEGSSARGTFDDVVMSDLPTTPGARLATSSQTVIAFVLEEPGAIGYVSLALLEAPLHAVRIDGVQATQETAQSGRYALTGVIRFVAREEPQGAARELLRWLLSEDGQAVVGERYAGLVR